ncbi:DUF397 domain-containing protein [Sphaerisporangium sp. NPDC004334]
MPGLDLSQVKWYKSSYSGGNGGSCVEVAGLPDGGIAVRDSKNVGPIVILESAGWRFFLASVKEERFGRRRGVAS